MRLPLMLAWGVVLGAPGGAMAQVDSLEHQQGPTPTGAIAGNGGLSVGLAPTGEFTDLLWPGPLGAEQITYQTLAAPDARTLPRLGAAETDGMFVGLRVETVGSEELTFLRDAEWEHSQRYEGAAIVTTSTRIDLGLSVTETTVVDGDAAGHQVVVDLTAGSPVLAVTAYLYGDLAPDGVDFAAYWDPNAEQVVQFRPHGGAPDAFDALLAASWDAQSWSEGGFAQMEEQVAAAGAGTFVVLAGIDANAAHLGARPDADCGFATPSSAWAAVQSDTLGSPVAGCDADLALRWELEFKDEGGVQRAVAELVFAFASRRADAGLAVDSLRETGVQGLRQRAEARAEEWLSGLELPSTAPTSPTNGEDFAVRWARDLLTLRSEDGAISASLASQPLLHRDRAGDGSFTELALELVGGHEAVSAHQQATLATQNVAAVFSPDGGELLSPPGAWMDDDAPFDLVQVGMTLWGAFRHAAFAANPDRSRDDLAAAWPALARGADLLTACVDSRHPARELAGVPPEGYPVWWSLLEDLAAGIAPDPSLGFSGAASLGWEAIQPCPSFEDGVGPARVTMRSVEAARLGLLAAAAAAEALCVEDPRVAAWTARANELSAVALGTLPAEPDGRDGALLLWPWPLEIEGDFVSLFSTSSDAEQQQLDTDAQTTTALETLAGALRARAAAAIELSEDGDGREALRLLAWARWTQSHGGAVGFDDQLALGTLLNELSSETGHLGAAFVALDDDADGSPDRAEQRVGQPHLPTESLALVALAAFEEPESFDLAERASLELTCATGEEPELIRVAPACGDDCQNSVSGGRSSTPGLLALLLALVAIRRRRV